MSRTVVLTLCIVLLAIFLGSELIGRVPATLHTPLMSGTNAIHGIVLLGAKDEPATEVRGFNGPARKGACHFLNVSLRIPAIDAEGVQLHQFARVVLVHTPWTPTRQIRELARE